MLVPSLALYGGVYAYERLTWTDRSKEHALKAQVHLNIHTLVSTIFKIIIVFMCIFNIMYINLSACVMLQFVGHMKSKVSTQIRATSNVYTGQLASNLSLLLEGLNGTLERCQQDENERIAQLTKEESRLNQLGDRGRRLK